MDVCVCVFSLLVLSLFVVVLLGFIVLDLVFQYKAKKPSGT